MKTKITVILKKTTKQANKNIRFNSTVHKSSPKHALLKSIRKRPI